MMITSDTLFTWPIATWLAIGIAVAVMAWRMTRRVTIMRQRVLLRAAVLALVFTPSWLISGEMLTAEFPVSAPLVPAWYLILRAVTDLAPGYLLCAVIPVAVATYLLWVGGMTLHHLLGRRRAG